MKKTERCIDADPSGEAGWNHNFTKHTNQFESSDKYLRVRTRCAQTVTECAKVRQATVFLAQAGPMETK